MSENLLKRNLTTRPKAGTKISSSLRTRIQTAFILLAVIPLVVTLVITSLLNIQNNRQQTISQLESVTSLKEREISTWLETSQASLSQLESEKNINIYERGILKSNASSFALETVRERYKSYIASGRFFEEIFLMDQSGQIVISSDIQQEGKIQASEPYFQEGIKGPFADKPTYSVPLKKYSLLISQPVQDQNGNVVGVIAGRANLDSLSKIMLERAGLGETGETYLVGSNYALLTPSRFEGFAPGESYIRTTGANTAIQKNANGAELYLDYQGVPVVGVYHWLPQLQVALIAEQNQSESFRSANIAVLVNIGLAVTAIIASIIVALLFTGTIVTPISSLVSVAQKIADGNLELQAESDRQDEIGTLASSFNTMTSKLRDLIANLENRIMERTNQLAESSTYNERRSRQFEAIGQVARTITVIQDINLLLPRITNLISEQFGFYHVGIFLLDDNREFAVLMAANTNSIGGKKMLARNHKLKVGQIGIVGYVTGTGYPRIALDTGADAVYFDNPDMPDTRSELALPLRIAGQVIGALDVQSPEANAFTQDDLQILSTLADQAATAIQNARSFEETRKLLYEAQSTVSGYMTESWKALRPIQRGLGYHFSGSSTKVLEAPLEGAYIKDALKKGVMTVSGENLDKLAIPIRLRGRVIGVMNLRNAEGQEWGQDQIDIATAISERLSLAIETATLLQTTQHSADIERVTSDISSRISSSTQFKTILQTAAQELSRALGGSDVLVQIEPNVMKMNTFE